jgi:hypothetical protein
MIGCSSVVGDSDTITRVTGAARGCPICCGSWRQETTIQALPISGVVTEATIENLEDLILADPAHGGEHMFELF